MLRVVTTKQQSQKLKKVFLGYPQSTLKHQMYEETFASNYTTHRCGWRIANFDGAYAG